MLRRECSLGVQRWREQGPGDLPFWALGPNPGQQLGLPFGTASPRHSRSSREDALSLRTHPLAVSVSFGKS